MSLVNTRSKRIPSRVTVTLSALVLVFVACAETPEPVVPTGPPAMPCSSQKECPKGTCVMDPCIVSPCTAGHCKE